VSTPLWGCWFVGGDERAVISGVGRSADAFWRWFAKTSRHTAATAAKACPSVRWLRRMAPGAVGAATVTTPWCAAATRGQAGWNPGVEQSRRDHRPGGEKATCGSLVHGHRAAGLPTLCARTRPRQVPATVYWNAVDTAILHYGNLSVAKPASKLGNPCPGRRGASRSPLFRCVHRLPAWPGLSTVMRDALR